jgi:acyl carrier protein
VEDWDSLAHINLVVAIEKRFRIKFALGELQSLKNVGDMLDLIARKARHE